MEKVTIQLEAETVTQIDELSDEVGLSRSAFLRMIVREKL